MQKSKFRENNEIDKGFSDATEQTQSLYLQNGEILVLSKGNNKLWSSIDTKI